jgi:hypothetical protein
MIRDVRDVIRHKGLCPIRVEQYYAAAAGQSGSTSYPRYS